MNCDEGRAKIWADIDQPWDVLVIGGGIVGAGVFRQAASLGLRTLLVDAHDFASGTSSRSSKMVHGGFRYLKNAQIKLTMDSVRERKRLLAEGQGLISQLPFTLVNYRGDKTPGWVFGLGLAAYDALALRWHHNQFTAGEIQEICPQVNEKRLLGGYQFYDAQTDDARLVLRVLQEGQNKGGVALNYAAVKGLLRQKNGRVVGVALQDVENNLTYEVKAGVVINATGAWADELRQHVDRPARLRRLRGSHLIFPHSVLPVNDVISFLHPQDHRPVFAFGWEGATLVGTTDLDHPEDMQTDPTITAAESEYLLQAVDHIFGCLNLTMKDVRSTMSGIRAVLNTGKADPSREARDEVLWNEEGLITITGGKLTMYRQMACETLKFARAYLPGNTHCNGDARALDVLTEDHVAELAAYKDLDPMLKLRLQGRYSHQTAQLLVLAGPGELELIPETYTTWAEIRWAAHAEQILHLDDLLLRRTRLGNLLEHGAREQLGRIRAIAQPELGWSDQRWQAEEQAYLTLWQASYSLPLTVQNAEPQIA